MYRSRLFMHLFHPRFAIARLAREQMGRSIAMRCVRVPPPHIADVLFELRDFDRSRIEILGEAPPDCAYRPNNICWGYSPNSSMMSSNHASSKKGAGARGFTRFPTPLFYRRKIRAPKESYSFVGTETDICRAPSRYDFARGGTSLRQVIFCQIDTLLSRLVKIVKCKTRKRARGQAGVDKKWKPASYPTNLKDIFVIQ